MECRAVITLAAQDIQKAALHAAAAIKNNPHLIYVKAVHEKCELSGKLDRGHDGARRNDLESEASPQFILERETPKRSVLIPCTSRSTPKTNGTASAAAKGELSSSKPTSRLIAPRMNEPMPPPLNLR